ATAEVAKLGDNPPARHVSDLLSRLEEWSIQPEDEKPLVELKLKVAQRLREQVKRELTSLQSQALHCATGAEGAQLHAQAGELLSLYPMFNDPVVLSEAKQLSEQQGVLAVRLETLRRQRYNEWAAQQIEKAINDYNKNSSYWS